MSTALPSSLAHFELLELVGEGAGSRVYRARDSRTGKEVALKVLGPHTGPGPDPTLRLKREFRAIQRLDHPGVVQVFELSSSAPAYIAMEYVEGKSLFEAVDIAPSSPVDEAKLDRLLELLEQVLAALDYVHSQHVLHRDLKPENILVDKEGRARLVDFGLATFLDRVSLTLTAQGTLVGTPRYIAPEQALGGPLDGRADLYSLGVMAYEAVGGRPPFEGRTMAESLTRRLNEEAPPLVNLTPELDPQLAEFVHQLLRREPEERHASAHKALEALRALRGAPRAARAAAAPQAELVAPRLVGREQPLGRLRVALENAEAGKPSLALVEAEAGLGKSRLLQELARLARRRNFLVLEAAAFEGATLPYAAFENVMDQLTRELARSGAAQAREALGVLAGALAWVHPELRDLDGFEDVETPGALDPQEGRRQVYEALRRLLEHMAATRPVLLSCEDLHRFDAVSGELVAHLHARCVARRHDSLPMLLVGAVRQGEQVASEGLATWLDARREDEDTLFIGLRPLDEPQTAAMLASMLADDRPRNEVARWLHEMTGGNPLFIEETLKGLRDEDRLSYSGSVWNVSLDGLSTRSLPSGELPLSAYEVPEKVRLNLARRLRPLSDGSRDLLRVACVLGQEFDMGLLARVADVDQATLFDAVDELLRQGLLMEPPGPADRLRFRHGLLRDLVASEMLPAAGRALHARVVEALAPEAQVNEDALIALAYHAAEAGDADTALDILPKAADVLESRYDTQGAAHMLREYLKLIAGLKPEERESRHRGTLGVRARLADLELLMGRPAKAEDEARTLLADAGSDRGALSDGHRVLAAALRRTGHLDEALTSARAALGACRYLRDRTSSLKARIELGRVHGIRGEATEACRHLRQAEALSNRLGDDIHRLEALSELGGAEYSRSRYRHAVLIQKRCVDLAESAHRRADLLRALRRLGGALYVLGEVDASRRVAERAMDIAREIGDPYGLCLQLDGLGTICHSLGRLGEAERFHREALDGFRQAGEFRPTLRAAVGLSDVLFDLGRFEEALAQLDEFLRDPRLTQLRREQAYPLLNIAQIELSRGGLDTAGRYLETAIRLTRDARNTPAELEAHRLLGRLHLTCCDTEPASKLFERARTMSKGIGDPRVLALVLCDYGDLRLAQRRPAQATRAFQRALDVAQHAELPIEALSARVGLAESSLNLRQKVELARNARDDARDIGLKVLVGRTAIILIRAAVATEALAALSQALDVAHDLGSPLLRFRALAASVRAGVGDTATQATRAREVLVTLDGPLGPFREGFYSCTDVVAILGQ